MSIGPHPYTQISGMGATPPQYGGTYQPPPQYGQTYGGNNPGTGKVSAYGNTYQPNPYTQIGGMGANQAQTQNPYMNIVGMGASQNQSNPYMRFAGMGNALPQYGQTYQPPSSTSGHQLYGGDAGANNPFGTTYGQDAGANNPMVYGQNAGANNPYSTTYGQNAGANNPYSTTYGGNAGANNPYSTTYGGDAGANNPYSTTYGQDAGANNPYQTVYGQNAGANAGDYADTMGGGVVDKSFMDFGGFVNENPEIFSGLTPGQVSALKNAYGDGTNGMANVMGMFQDPAFQGLAAPSGPDLSGLQQDTTVWGDWNYDGPQDVYAFEQGVADSNLMRLDNGASWVYKDRNGNVVGEVSKTMNAADRMANAGVDTASIEEMMRRTIGNYNRRIEDEYMRTQGDTSQLVVDPVIPANPVVDPVIDNEAPLPEPQETDTVLQYQSPVLPGLAQLPGQREALWSMMTGETSVPYLDKILAGSRERQSKEMDYMKAGLSNRGVLNSTPGMRELSDLGIRHDAGNAQAALQALGMVAPQMQGAINSTYEQDMGIDKNAYQQWSDTTRLQSDLDWRRDQSKNQSLQLLLQAINGGGGSVPGYNVPGAEPGFLSNIFQTWGNAGFPT